MNDLAERFAAAIDDLEVPDTDLADRVIEDLLAPVDLATRRRADQWSRTNRLVVASAAVILIILAVVIIDPARSAVADFLGIGAVRIERGGPALTETSQPGVPGPDRSASPAPDDSPADDAVNPIPSLGQPRVNDGADARRRTYSWPDAAPGVTLEVRIVDGPLELKRLGAEHDSEFLRLDVDGGASTDTVEVTALWIPNVHLREITEGQPAVTVGPTLLWEQDGIQYRLEAPIDRDTAVALAKEIRGGTDLLAAG